MRRNKKKFEAGDQMRYVFIFHSSNQIVQYVRSHAEAESWADVYSRTGLSTWYRG
jgi:hypothetical protein